MYVYWTAKVYLNALMKSLRL